MDLMISLYFILCILILDAVAIECGENQTLFVLELMADTYNLKNFTNTYPDETS